MTEYPVLEAEMRLRDTQEALDRMLRFVFDAGTRRVLRQVQVHIHEALQILQEDGLRSEATEDAALGE
jgi:hypothetical protein